MTAIPYEHGLALAAILFALGLIGLLARRNIIFVLLSIEVMLNAAGLAFVVAGSRWGQADGQVMFIFILTMAAAEVSVGLALVLLESCLLSLLGGALGLGLAELIVARGDPTHGMLPLFYFPSRDLIIGLGFSLALGLVTGIFPALQAMRLRVADALRRM